MPTKECVTVGDKIYWRQLTQAALPVQRRLKKINGGLMSWGWEDNMPTKECVTVGDKIYCWNKETKQIDIYIRKSVPVEQCSPAVVTLLMELLGKKNLENTDDN